MLATMSAPRARTASTGSGRRMQSGAISRPRASTRTAFSSGSQQQEAPKAPSYKYDPSGDQQYQEALGRLQEAQKTQAPSYAGTYDKQLEDIYNKIVGRKDFSYDVNEDALYQQYKDQYTTLGKQAMQDTLGQAAALTGGYDSTYAQGAAQQQYDAYLQRLGDVVPDLYDKAYDRYQQEGTDMMQQYQMLGGLRDTEYSRYQDEYNRYMDNLQQLQQHEGDLYNRGYTQWQNEQEMSYERQQDAYQKAVNLITTLGYMPSAEELAAAGMSQDEAQRWLAYYQQQMAAASSGGGGGGGGGRGRGGSSKSSRTSPQGVDDATYKNIRDEVVLTAIHKSKAEAAQKLLQYADQLSDRQLAQIDAYYKSRKTRSN